MRTSSPVTVAHNSFVWDNYNGLCEHFSENSGPRNKAVNVLDIIQTYLLFFTEDFVIQCYNNSYFSDFYIDYNNLLNNFD